LYGTAARIAGRYHTRRNAMRDYQSVCTLGSTVKVIIIAAAAAAATTATATAATTNQMLHAILRMGRAGIGSQGIILLRRTLLRNRIAVLLSYGISIKTNAMVRGMYMS
jgi:hypothetical protein